MLNVDAHSADIEWAPCREQLLFPMYPTLTISSVESTYPLGNNTYPHTPLGGCVSPPLL